MLNLNLWKIKRISKKIKAMHAFRVNNQPSDEVLKKEAAYYFELAKLYKKMKNSKNVPYASIMYIEAYRVAASLDDAEAHYILGKHFLEEAKYRKYIDNEGLFNSPENLKLCQDEFKEAHSHLLAAEKLNHIEAKRLRGLAIINGWGTEVDKNAGFELIVASIEQEGSWDQVPQIFASMGLNKPEFFSAIMQRRKK